MTLASDAYRLTVENALLHDEVARLEEALQEVIDELSAEDMRHVARKALRLEAA